jgi:CRP-like cAMP-binding protein
MAEGGRGMELVGRMMDGSIPFGGPGRLEPVASGSGLDHDQKMRRLEEVTIFQDCNDAQLEAVARVAGVFEGPSGTVLTRAGEPGEEFYLILDGTVRVDVSPTKQVLLRPGEFFGEMSLLDGEPRSATVVAETPLRLIVIKRRDFSTLLEQVPGLTQTLLATLSRRLRQAERALAERARELS